LIVSLFSVLSEPSVANSSVFEILLDGQHSTMYNTYLTNKLDAYELEGKSQKGKGKRKNTEYRRQDTEDRGQKTEDRRQNGRSADFRRSKSQTCAWLLRAYSLCSSVPSKASPAWT